MYTYMHARSQQPCKRHGVCIPCIKHCLTAAQSRAAGCHENDGPKRAAQMPSHNV